MKAILPAAGIGTRLRPYTYSVPKILLNVAGKPMICYIIDDLINSGKINNVFIIVGHLGDMVQEYISKRYENQTNIEISFIEQKEMLGLGHAVYQANKYLSNEPVVIVLGDTIFEFDLNGFLNSAESTIGYKNVEDTSRFGIIELKNGNIKKLIEKPAPGLTDSKKAIAGIYYINNSDTLFNALKYIIEKDIRTKNEFQLTDALQHMVDTGEKFKSFEIQNWFDCGNPETLLSTNHYLLGKLRDETNYADKYPNSAFTKPVYIGENCVIENSVIGPFTTIAENTTIRNSIIESSIIGDNSLLDKVFLSNSIIGSNVNVKGDNKQLYIGDSADVKL